MANKIKKKERDFVQVSNSILRDNNLSFKAKGLFCYMFSMADNWNFTIRSIATQQKDGEASIISSMNELKELGYISYTKHQNGSGTYYLDDTPNIEKPNVENPNLGKSTPIKKNQLDKNKNSKVHSLLNEYKHDFMNKNNLKTSPVISSVELSYLNDFISYRKKIKKSLNTIAPLKAYWIALKALHELGYDINDCVKQMKSNEWQTLKIEYIHKDSNKNKVKDSNDDWSERK